MAIGTKNPWDYYLNGVATENPVQYEVGAGATLIGLQQPAILGGNYTAGPSSLSPLSASTIDIICVASNPANYNAANPAIPATVAPWPGCPALTTGKGSGQWIFCSCGRI